MAKIIDGKLISAKEREIIAEETATLKNSGITPGLAVIIVGEDPASKVYVRNKEKSCIEVGFNSWVIRMPEETKEEELLAKIDDLNADSEVDGILVQLPLPKHIDEKKVIAAICPQKDVDAFHLENTGRIMVGDYKYLPCTPAGIMTMLEHENIDVCGKECVVVGRSNIVGKPMAMLLLNKSGTVTVCHSRTKDLAEVTRRADILVVAVGRAEFITGDMIKPGAVVIDVGINRCEDGKLRGDVHFESAEKTASAITPVPGGVGPMTITTLLKNTLTAAKARAEKSLN
ncbi:MAG: bifunctional methylenetetrahydrofolate dehydrogenase/methenyltetrahydrofolate cyclohydrolase FolD [Ruminococcaceae bacterium]|nr:bifunctional methylenetetrahydrofolate dehydrogenase/methenyltetrahydrofolate cyclohydrolase FolD [Oscillospiraceae bacterium]